MSVNTSNSYGRITISNNAIAQVTVNSVLDCYGIVDIVSVRLRDIFADILRRPHISKGVKVVTMGDRIYLSIYVTVKYGVSIEAVAQSLKKTVKYNVERFTGMIVDAIDVRVTGVKA